MNLEAPGAGSKKHLTGGDADVVEYVQRFLRKPPSDGYKKLEEADWLDLACEWLIVNANKPYAHLFSDADRAAGQQRLVPQEAAIEARTPYGGPESMLRARSPREAGLPRRPDLESSLRTRHPR